MRNPGANTYLSVFLMLTIKLVAQLNQFDQVAIGVFKGCHRPKTFVMRRLHRFMSVAVKFLDMLFQ